RCRRSKSSGRIELALRLGADAFGSSEKPGRFPRQLGFTHLSRFGVRRPRAHSTCWQLARATSAFAAWRWLGKSASARNTAKPRVRDETARTSPLGLSG